MFRSPRILLFEDDEDDYIILRDFIADRCQLEDVHFDWYQKVENVEEILKKHDPDVIFIDYRLAETTGTDLAKQIRKHNSIVSLILLTGLPEDMFEEIESASEGLVLSEFLTKRDLTSRSLTRSIQYAIEGSRQRRQLNQQAIMMEEVLLSGHSALWSREVKADGTIFCSDSIEALTGFTKADLESSSIEWSSRVHDDDREAAIALVRDAGAMPTSATYRFRKKDGSLIWIEETCARSKQPFNEAVELISGRLQDITVRRSSEEQIRLMATALEQLTEAVIVTDSELDEPGPRILYVNPAAVRMTGYSKEELIGSTPRILQGPKTDRELRNKLKRDLQAGKDFEAKTWNYRKDGSEYYFSWKISPIRDPKGHVTHFLGTQRDITNEYAKQIELDRQQNFLREIGELAQIGGWRYDKSAKKVFWTDQVYNIHGVDPSGPVDIDLALSFYTGKSLATMKEVFTQCINKGIPYDEVLILNKADGVKLWVRNKGEPLIQDGEIVGAWGVSQNISEVYQLQFENEIFSDLAIEFSCVADRVGHFLELNERWELLLGHTREELMSCRFYDFIHPEDREATEKAIDKLLGGGDLMGFENRYRHRDGHYLHLSWNAVLGPEGSTVYAMARDITEHKGKEIDLQNALAAANIANEAKNQFLMVMSHELRTPLNPILGCADLLSQEVQDPSQLELLGYIKDSARHLTSVITDILDISTVEAGRIVIQKEPFDLVKLLKDSLSLMQPKAVEKKIDLKLVVGESWLDPTRCAVVSDRRKLRQILFNLITNALKFTRKGSVTVELMDLVSEENSEVIIRVSDTGIGIEEKHLDSVFERFYQVNMNASREFQGQGLGLALCRELARAMDGDVTVESELGKGSTFTLILPMERIGQQDDNRKQETLVANPAQSSPAQTQLKVLLVEDDPVNQMVMKAMLKRLNCIFVIAENGVEGVELAEKNPFDLILMDIQMPEMNGIEATQKIRNGNSSNRNVPIVAVSAHAVDKIKQSGFQAGMNGFLEKPVSLSQLTEVMEKVRNSGYSTHGALR
jgi:PAS domain S-box-containing protein